MARLIRPRLAAVLRNLIVCRHDGTLLHTLSSAVALDARRGRQPPDFAALLEDGAASGERAAWARAHTLRAIAP